MKSTKKPDKWKKHSVSIFVLTTVFEEMCPHLIWDFLSYLSRKKGISETFLSLGLFISRPRPTASASKMRPRLQKTFPRFPFFYFGNFGQISNQTWTNFSSDVLSTKIETKYYYFSSLIQNFETYWIKLSTVCLLKNCVEALLRYLFPSKNTPLLLHAEVVGIHCNLENF